MGKFAYVALNAKNKPINGISTLPDKSSVYATLVKQGLRPVSIRRADQRKGLSKAKIFSFGSSNKIKSAHLVMFTRQLSAMVGAGVPLLRALMSLEQHSESEGLKKVIAAIIKNVQGGVSLGDALSHHPKVFSDVYVNMVRAGETAGILDEILRRLAQQQEKNASMKKKIKSAMTYPMVLLVITVLAFFGLMLFVIPQIGTIIKDLGGPDAKLPFITLMMLGISDFITSWWYIIIPVIAGSIYVFMRWLKTPKGRRWFHTTILRVPAVKDIITKVAVARFARTFSALMGAGVAVLEALDVTGRAIGNVVYEDALKQAGKEVKNGDLLSHVIERNELFPPIVAQMLAVGEETGQTDKVLVKVADFYEEEVDVAIGGVSAIIEPVMIVVMGGMVGLIAASVMVPIASMSQNIKA